MLAVSFVPAFVNVAETFCMDFCAFCSPLVSEEMSAAILTTRFLITAKFPHLPYLIFTPFSAAIALSMASPLLLPFFFGLLRASFISRSIFGNRFCRASASVCQARHRIFSNSSWAVCRLCFAKSVSSYGVYSHTAIGSIPMPMTACSAIAERLSAADVIPPGFRLPWLRSVCRMPMSRLLRFSPPLR